METQGRLQKFQANIYDLEKTHKYLKDNTILCLKCILESFSLAHYKERW